MWPSAAAWVSALRLALFGYRPLAEHMRAGTTACDSARLSALGDAGDPDVHQLDLISGWLTRLDNLRRAACRALR